MRKHVIRLLLWVALSAGAVLAVGPLASAVYGIGWTPPAVVAGRCWGPVCVLRVNSDGSGLEVSWLEYQQPPPVVSGGPPIIP